MRRKRRAKVEAVSTPNPIQILTNFSPMVETSLQEQNQTNYQLASNTLTNLNVRPAFGVIATILLYTPGDNTPVTAYDYTGNQSNRRSYTKLYQLKFGKGFILAQFLLNTVGPIDGQTIVFSHGPCQRRAVLADQIVNVDTPDQQVFDVSIGRQSSDIESGNTDDTIETDEMVYGVIATGGNITDYVPPPDYTAINVAASGIDNFDIALRTYYKFTTNTGSYHINASGSGRFVWGAAVQTFEALAL